MTLFGLLQLAIGVLQVIAQGSATKLDDLALASLGRALDELRAVQGSEVTKAQLESLRVEKLWESP